MPLRDHFHPPLSVRRHWHAFHNAWATFIATENCESFLAKCAVYLQQGVGLVVVDVVTTRTANLHKGLLSRFDAELPRGHAADLYAGAYRPVERNEQASLDIWHEGLAVGGSLPTMPLWLLGGLCLPADLDSTYERTCVEQRLSEGE
jgi:hypothetical protein